VKTKLSSATVGMFVLGALLLGVIAFLSFGGTNVFSKPTRFLVYFDESVSGLDPGASVKLSGVRVGRVAVINVRFDQARKESHVQVTCEVDRNILTDSAGQQIDLTSPAELQNLIDRGLRARLSLTGITGLLFVELKFEDARVYPANPRYMTEQYPVVPAITSPISEVQQSIVEIVANIKKVDFADLSKQLKTLLATTNRKVDDLDVKDLSGRIARAADAVQALASSPEAKQTFAKLNAAIDQAKATLAKLDTQVGSSAEEFRRTLDEAQAALKSLTSAADTTRRFVQSQGQLGDEVTQAMQQVADAAASLERLADALDRDPSSLIVGKKKPSSTKP
jgi:paraquat-inducible protein B